MSTCFYKSDSFILFLGSFSLLTHSQVFWLCMMLSCTSYLKIGLAKKLNFKVVSIQGYYLPESELNMRRELGF